VRLPLFSTGSGLAAWWGGDTLSQMVVVSTTHKIYYTRRNNVPKEAVVRTAGGIVGVLTYIIAVYVLDIRDAKSLKQLLPKRRSKKTS